MDDPESLAEALTAFIEQHHTEFSEIPKRHSHLLEMGALTLACQHYRSRGMTLQPQNLQEGFFRMKLGSRGYHENFSWFETGQNGRYWEIHTNVNVTDGWNDGARYCLDIGIVTKGAKWEELSGRSQVSNGNLITWAEAKSLVVYPMLLAQFVGIVHEVTPDFLGGRRPWGFLKQEHFDPALICEGHLSQVGKAAVDGFARRNYKINVVHESPRQIVRFAQDGDLESPFHSPK